MTRVRSAAADELRVIMCVAFDHRAPFEDVARFKQCIVNCAHVRHAVQLTGTFDFMVEASFRDLSEYQEKLATLAEPAAKLVARYEANFVCKRFIREDDAEHAIWVPCHHGLQRVQCSKIDLVEAEGDYMRVRSGEQSWLLHTTMHDLKSRLDPSRFVSIHRSILLRCDFIERLLHEGRHWFARLRNGETKSVAKSHVRQVTAMLGIDIAGHVHGPARAIDETRPRIAE